MSRREEYETRTEQLLVPIAEANQVSIYDVEYVKEGSPGLGRALKKDKHLQVSIGQEVEIKLFKPIDKCKEFSGILESFDADVIVIRDGETARTFERSDVALIRLAFDF